MSDEKEETSETRDLTSAPEGNTSLAEPIDLTSAEVLGAGGEHFVFLTPESPEEAIKVNYPSIGILQENPQSPLPQQEAQRRNDGLQQLSEFFPGHVPQSHTEVTSVTLSADQVKSLYKELGQEDRASEINVDTIEFPALVTKQEVIPLKQSEEIVTFGINSLPDEISQDQLDDMENDFLCTDGNKDHNDYQEELEALYPSLAPLFEKTQSSPEWKQEVREFVEGLIRFTETTGQAIDIEGQGNVIFYKHEGKLDYTLLDVLQLEPQNYGSSADRFHRWLQGDRENTNIQDIVPHSVHQLRALNLMARLVESPARLHSLPNTDLQNHVHEVVEHLKAQV